MNREQLAEILTERELQAWLCATRLPPSSGQDRVGARRVGLVLGISRERARELLRNAARKIAEHEDNGTPIGYWLNGQTQTITTGRERDPLL